MEQAQGAIHHTLISGSTLVFHPIGLVNERLECLRL